MPAPAPRKGLDKSHPAIPKVPIDTAHFHKYHFHSANQERCHLTGIDNPFESKLDFSKATAPSLAATTPTLRTSASAPALPPSTVEPAEQVLANIPPASLYNKLGYRASTPREVKKRMLVP